MIDEKALTDLAKKSLKEWDLDVQSINLHLQSENTVFKVEDKDGNEYALRVHRKGYHDLDELNSEHNWTSCLSNAGLSVPEAVPTANGEAYATVFFNDSDEFRYVGLVKWMEGTILDNLILELKEKEVGDLYNSLGRVVAKFHQVTMNWDVPEDFKRHSFDIEGFVGNEPFWGRFWEAKNASDDERDKLSLIRKNI